MTIRRKLCSRRGTTLIELMAAVAITVILSLMLNTGFRLLVNAYHTMTAESEAQLLMSTASNLLMEELYYASNIITDASGSNTSGKVTKYDSDTYGAGVNLTITNGQLTLTGAGSPKYLLASGAYGSNGVYKLELLRTSGGANGITYDSSTGIFTFTLRVLENSVVKAEREFQVRCLNGG